MENIYKIYAELIKKGEKSIEDVPERIQENVMALLEQTDNA